MPGIRHNWNLTPRQAVKLQDELTGKVIEQPLSAPVKTVAGIDCTYIKQTGQILTAAVLFSADRLERLEAVHHVGACRFPYVPGLLSFREAPSVIAAVNKFKIFPDLLLCDGQGLAHPRGLGLAAHIGLWLDVPAIGVAKSRLCGEYRMPGANRGCSTRLMYKDRVIGRVVRTRTNVKPLFISVGHRVTLADAVRWTLRCTRGCRLPEPTRRAHLEVTRLRTSMLDPGISRTM